MDRVPAPVELWARGAWHTFGTPLRVARFGVQSVRQAARFVPFLRRPGGTPPIPFQAPSVSFDDELTPAQQAAYESITATLDPNDPDEVIGRHVDTVKQRIAELIRQGRDLREGRITAAELQLR